jgi:hypothetical protein
MNRVTRVVAIAALTLTAASAAVVSAGPAGADPTPPDPAHMIVDKTIGNVDGIGPLSGLMNILSSLTATPAPH